jgi:hypothetical protein
MVIDQIKAELKQQPFRPFIVESSSRNLIPVERPNWVVFPPDLDQMRYLHEARNVDLRLRRHQRSDNSRSD